MVVVWEITVPLWPGMMTAPVGVLLPCGVDVGEGALEVLDVTAGGCGNELINELIKAIE